MSFSTVKSPRWLQPNEAAKWTPRKYFLTPNISSGAGDDDTGSGEGSGGGDPHGDAHAARVSEALGRLDVVFGDADRSPRGAPAIAVTPDSVDIAFAAQDAEAEKNSEALLPHSGFITPCSSHLSAASRASGRRGGRAQMSRIGCYKKHRSAYFG